MSTFYTFLKRQTLLDLESYHELYFHIKPNILHNFNFMVLKDKSMTAFLKQMIKEFSRLSQPRFICPSTQRNFLFLLSNAHAK